jgi:serine/threonine-protein kinase
VFALGIVLYELTTGRRCFDGTNNFDRMLAVTRGAFVRPRALDPDYPRDLEQVVLTALEPDPEHRFASAAALLDVLAWVAVAHGWAADAAAIARAVHAARTASCSDDVRTADELPTIAMPFALAA